MLDHVGGRFPQVHMGRAGDTDQAEAYQQADSPDEPPIQILKVFSDVHRKLPLCVQIHRILSEKRAVSYEPEKTFKKSDISIRF